MLKKGDKIKWKFRYGKTQRNIIKIPTSDFIFINRQLSGSQENKNMNC